MPRAAGPRLPGLEPVARSSSCVYPLCNQPSRSYALHLAARLALQTGSSAEETPAQGWRRSRPAKGGHSHRGEGVPAMLVPPAPEQRASAASLYGLAHPPTLDGPAGGPDTKVGPGPDLDRTSVRAQPGQTCRPIPGQRPALRPPSAHLRAVRRPGPAQASARISTGNGTDQLPWC